MNRRNLILGAGALTSLSGFAASRSSASISSDGYYVPAEEARHERTFMQWPASKRVYGDPYLRDETQRTIAQIANTIAEFEPVTMLAAKSDHEKARQLLSAKVELWDIPTEDLWCRDAGPVFVVNDKGHLAVRQIQFNGWGRKQVHRRDSQIARRVAEQLKLPFLTTDIVGEAGGVEQDGHGLLMAHESSWVNDNRNPGMSRAEIETHLLAAYGADRMIWSPGVWGEDITDYHIDSLARFTGAGRVLLNLPDELDPEDPYHLAGADTHDALVATGLDVEVIPEPVHGRVKDFDFVSSYVNYYVCNGAVIGAEFGDTETDALAVEALKRHYPGREVISLNVDALGYSGGGIHCATQQMPAVS